MRVMNKLKVERCKWMMEVKVTDFQMCGNTVTRIICELKLSDVLCITLIGPLLNWSLSSLDEKLCAFSKHFFHGNLAEVQHKTISVTTQKTAPFSHNVGHLCVPKAACRHVKITANNSLH